MGNKYHVVKVGREPGIYRTVGPRPPRRVRTQTHPPYFKIL
jgi:hypothetical protein